jgi:hypothetical protein
MAQSQTPVGVYVNRLLETAFFTILLPDNTCGMFLMPSARDVFYMGFTTYKVEDDKILFKVQTAEAVDPRNLSEEELENLNAAPDQFINSTWLPGKKYTQHGDKGDTDFDFVTTDTKFWQKNGWDKIGEARQLDGMNDYEFAHEVRKLCLAVIEKYGPGFIWA